MDVQKKWKGLRNCFARELRLQKKTKSGQTPSKRRKYIYFDRLLFLLPSIENRDTSSNFDDDANTSDTENDVEAPTPEPCSEESVRVGRKRRCTPPKNSFEESLLKILKEKRTVDTDEDVNFALSLVPMLKSLSDYEKMDAKIQIMNVLKLIKWPRHNSLSMPEITPYFKTQTNFYAAGPPVGQNASQPPPPRYIQDHISMTSTSYRPGSHGYQMRSPSQISMSAVSPPGEDSVQSLMISFTDESDSSELLPL